MPTLAATTFVQVDVLSDPAYRLGWSLVLTAAGIGAGFGAIAASKGTRPPRALAVVGGAVAVLAAFLIMVFVARWANNFVAEAAHAADLWPWFLYLGVVLVLGALATAGGFAIGTAVRTEQGRTTWAGAVLGAVLVFGWMLLAYAVFPDAWIQFADAKLLWTPDKLFYGNPAKTAIPFNITYQALRDLIAVGVYTALGVANLVLIIQWQKRFVVKATPAAGEVTAKRSRFSRPLFRGAR